MKTQGIEAAISLGQFADDAWRRWKTTATGTKSQVPQVTITHPTQPESSSKNDQAKLAQATAALLANWNQALQTIRPAIAHPDTHKPLVPYGDAFKAEDKKSIPSLDLPAGTPTWQFALDGWATRIGANAHAKRANLTMTVPSTEIPSWPRPTPTFRGVGRSLAAS
jgi:hypothetical protein